MAGKRGSTRKHEDEEWLLNAYDWITAPDGGVEGPLTITLAPTSREGVWQVTVREWYRHNGKPWGVRRTYSTQYPTAHKRSLGAALFDAVACLDKAAIQEQLPIVWGEA